jgi:hypothetical protein
MVGFAGKVGGLDEDDYGSLIVEIDETAFGKRKYNRGRVRNTRWRIERKSRRMFAEMVERRDAATLLPILRDNVDFGSHIMSDRWAAYEGVKDIDGGVYSHSVVIHEDNFVDPDNEEVHTQNIESAWNDLKKKLKRQRGTSDALHSVHIYMEIVS